MQIKVFKASSMKEAVAKMKDELGDDAVILHTKKYNEGGLLGFGSKEMVEITAAIEDEKPAPKKEIELPPQRTAPIMPNSVLNQYKTNGTAEGVAIAENILSSNEMMIEKNETSIEDVPINQPNVNQASPLQEAMKNETKLKHSDPPMPYDDEVDEESVPYSLEITSQSISTEVSKETGFVQAPNEIEDEINNEPEEYVYSSEPSVLTPINETISNEIQSETQIEVQSNPNVNETINQMPQMQPPIQSQEQVQSQSPIQSQEQVQSQSPIQSQEQVQNQQPIPPQEQVQSQPSIQTHEQVQAQAQAQTHEHEQLQSSSQYQANDINQFAQTQAMMMAQFNQINQMQMQQVIQQAMAQMQSQTQEQIRQAILQSQSQNQNQNASQSQSFAQSIEKPKSSLSEGVTTELNDKDSQIKIKRLENEVAQMKALLAQVMGKESKGTITLHEALSRQEVNEQILNDMAAHAEAGETLSDYQSKNAKMTLTKFLNDNINFSEGIRLNRHGVRIVALLGTTGVGKTTTLAKIAAKFVLEQGITVALITADTYRISAVEQLRTYSDILGLPLEIVYSPIELNKAINKHRSRDLILIDTAGRSQHNDYQMKDLQEFLNSNQRIEKHLVMSSTTKLKDANDILEKFSVCEPDKLIFTKTDETASLGLIVNLLYNKKLSMSYMTNGQSVPDDISAANAEMLADMLLRKMV